MFQRECEIKWKVSKLQWAEFTLDVMICTSTNFEEIVKNPILNADKSKLSLYSSALTQSFTKEKFDSPSDVPNFWRSID